MRFPYWIVRNSPWPGRMGRLFTGKPFVAWTFLCFMHFPTRWIDVGDLRHERDHVKFFWLFWAASLVMWILFSRSWLWLPLTPFTYSIVYGAASVIAWVQGGNPYADNWFERHADQVAGEP